MAFGPLQHSRRLQKMFSEPSGYYETLPHDETLESDTQRTAVSRRKSLWTAVAALLVALTVIAILLTHRSTESSQVELGLPCGQTVAEAEAAGCTYDRLAHLWLPRECSRSRNTDYLSYDNGKPFQYWLDGDGLQPVDISQQAYGTGVFSTTKEHLAHCAFTLLRTSDWMRNRGRWERKVLNPNHFEHCVMLLLNATQFHPKLNDIESYTRLAFSGPCYSNVLK